MSCIFVAKKESPSNTPPPMFSGKSDGGRAPLHYTRKKAEKSAFVQKDRDTCFCYKKMQQTRPGFEPRPTESTVRCSTN